MTVDIGSNLIANPSLKTTTSGWVTAGGTLVKTSAGGRFQRASGATNVAYTKVTASAGYKYALTGVQYRRSSGTGAFGVVIAFFNAAGTQVGAASWDSGSATAQNVWFTAPRLEATAPAGTAYLRLYVRQPVTTTTFDYYATNFVLKRAADPATITIANYTSQQGLTKTITAAVTAGTGAVTQAQYPFKWDLLGWPGTAADRPAFYEGKWHWQGADPNVPNLVNIMGPFKEPGVVTARLTVKDSLGVVATKDFTVTVAAGNAPTANAGSDQTVYVGATANLAGSAVTVDAIASWAWSTTSGVTITSPTAQNTAVGPFTMPGAYTFTLEATDTNGKAGTEDVVINVIPVPESTAINERVRLEVLADDVVSLIQNHSAKDGVTTGWETFGGDTLVATSGNTFGNTGHAFRLQSTDTQASAYSSNIPIIAKQYVSGSVEVKLMSSGFVLCSLQFYNPSGFISSQSRSVDTVGLQKITVPPIQIPDTATYMVFSVQANNGTSVQDAYFWNAQFLMSDNPASITDVPFNDDGDYWQNILGQSVSVSTSRGASLEGVTDSLEAGLLTAVVVDPSIAPDKSTRVRPGKQMRLRAFNNSTSTWDAVWTGSITEANVAYRQRKPVITISATDAVTDLTNIQVPSAVSGAFRQRVNAALTDQPVLYQVTDTDADSTSVVLSVDEQGTALSQLELARNSTHSIIYVDKTNTLQAYAANSLPSTTPVVTFSDSAADVGAIQYRDIDVNFGSKALINTLSVEKRDAVGEYGQYTYGPYLNTDSVNDWGTQSATLVINDGDPVTQAGYYLSTFSNPQIFPTSVTFRSDNNLSQSINLELYQAARVKFADAGLDGVYRIMAIEHDVLPDSWETKVYFRPLEATGSITVSVPALGPLTGPVDLLPPKPVGTGTAVSPYANTVQFQRIGNIVIATGGITRASGFSGTAVNAVLIPDGYKPMTGFGLPGSTYALGSTAWYQISVTTTAIQIRQSTGNTGAAFINATWVTTDPYP